MTEELQPLWYDKTPFSKRPKGFDLTAAVAALLAAPPCIKQRRFKPPVYRSRMSLPHTYMLMARLLAEARSKDPNTRVGAVLVDNETNATLFGYNGFPASMEDLVAVWNNRDASDPHSKYSYVRHAELNVLNKAAEAGLDRRRCTLYCTLMPCLRCAIDSVIGSGLRHLICGDIGYGTEEIFTLIRAGGTEIGLLSENLEDDPGYVLCDTWQALTTLWSQHDRIV